MLATSVADKTETVDTGPTINCGEEPSIAYTRRAMGTAYRPT
jgi:hypothetical protein